MRYCYRVILDGNYLSSTVVFKNKNDALQSSIDYLKGGINTVEGDYVSTPRKIKRPKNIPYYITEMYSIDVTRVTFDSNEQEYDSHTITHVVTIIEVIII